jgi:hypothetical protein
MPYPTLVGLTGYAQHGKDTAGRFLTETYGFVRFAFADQLKELALIIDPIIDQVHGNRLSLLVGQVGWDEAKRNPEVRRILQELGTGVRDVIGADAWVDALARKVDEEVGWTFEGQGIVMPGQRAHPAKPVVITDVRFPNEAAWIHDNGGVVVRVNRQAADGRPYDNGIGTSHPSEAHVATLRVDEDVTAKDVETLRHLMAVVMVAYSSRVTAEKAGMA